MPICRKALLSPFCAVIHRFVSEGFVPLHPDFEERLDALPECSGEIVKFFILSDIDIVISKLGRGAEGDIEDIVKSGILNKIDLSELKKKCFLRL